MKTINKVDTATQKAYEERVAKIADSIVTLSGMDAPLTIEAAAELERVIALHSAPISALKGGRK